MILPKAMEVKKDIGKAIREKLDNLDRMPGDALWDAISMDLDSKKKKKFPFFWFYIGACTIIGITVAAFILSNPPGGNYNTTGTTPDGRQNSTSIVTDNPKQNNNSHKLSGGKNPENNITTTDEPVSAKEKSNIKNNNGASVANTSIKSGSEQKATGSKAYQTNTVAAKSNTDKKQFAKNRRNARNTNNSFVNRQAISKNNLGHAHIQINGNPEFSTGKSGQPDNLNNNITDNNRLTDPKTPVSQPAAIDNSTTISDRENTSSSIDTKNIGTLKTEGITDTTKVVTDSLKTETPKEEVAEEKAENKKDSLAPKIFKKFSVFAFAGPSSFSFPDHAVVTDSTTSNINTKSTIRLGMLFGYRINSKLSIRTGISLYKLKQSAKNIKLSYYMETSTTGGALIVPPPDFTWIDYEHPFGQNSSLIINTLGENYQAIINIDRELSYLEIPLEINYNLLDRKFSLNIFGGGSILLLNKNEVFAYNEKGKMFLGEWNAAAKTSFTGILGLGLHYTISPSLQVNAEPVFNYYFNTYNDSKPYSFTVRAGIQYNFDFK